MSMDEGQAGEEYEARRRGGDEDPRIRRYTWLEVGRSGPKQAMYVTYEDHLSAVAAALVNERAGAEQRTRSEYGGKP